MTTPRPWQNDLLFALALLAIVAGLREGAEHGFAAAWAAARACDARGGSAPLLRCATVAPWTHLSVTHAVVNAVALLPLWRRLRSAPPALVALTGMVGGVLGSVAASLLFGVPVTGASTVVHGWLGAAVVGSRRPLGAVDLMVLAAVLGLGASLPTWCGHLVATSLGAALTLLLASRRAPR